MQENPILNADEIKAVVGQLAQSIQEKHGTKTLAIVGIHTRGVILADRLAAQLEANGAKLERGTLDISLYRDDLSNLNALPNIRSSDIPFEVQDATILLCDDVLFTGRTIRAAMNLILDYGRPERIELVVLADRGHRELPIAPTYTGVTVDTDKADYLRVHFNETDGHEQIVHYKPESP